VTSVRLGGMKVPASHLKRSFDIAVTRFSGRAAPC
jgi:hypothetical protein